MVWAWAEALVTSALLPRAFVAAVVTELTLPMESTLSVMLVRSPGWLLKVWTVFSGMITWLLLNVLPASKMPTTVTGVL